MKGLKKLKLDVDSLHVDTFQASDVAARGGTVNGHASIAICSGSCTAFGSCGSCLTASAERPYCY